mmetsp:Transcript_95746/g.298154  ORF Transcript_95746/g.298154 Transcript_95746/m.298154 type:complete len:291 (+) Transcript_95746:387-1259(+)
MHAVTGAPQRPPSVGLLVRRFVARSAVGLAAGGLGVGAAVRLAGLLLFELLALLQLRGRGEQAPHRQLHKAPGDGDVVRQHLAKRRGCLRVEEHCESIAAEGAANKADELRHRLVLCVVCLADKPQLHCLRDGPGTDKGDAHERADDGSWNGAPALQKGHPEPWHAHDKQDVHNLRNPKAELIGKAVAQPPVQVGGQRQEYGGQQQAREPTVNHRLELRDAKMGHAEGHTNGRGVEHTVHKALQQAVPDVGPRGDHLAEGLHFPGYHRADAGLRKLLVSRERLGKEEDEK